ncbi:MAG: tyrosine-type recombinase/integrase [Candidatus Korobacteraceae bacterium]|jgi:integrase
MMARFHGPLALDLQEFLHFKRSLGYGYARAEFTLLEFDRFLQEYAIQHREWRLDQAILAWLSSKPPRKAISVNMDAAVLRQFCSYLRRLPHRPPIHEPLWPQLPTESTFTPYVLSEKDVRRLLELSAGLDRPPFRAALYRALLLLLYCTGIRFGEALRLRLRDVDTRAGVLFVEMFKGRARWVPFHRSLAQELDKYLLARQAFAPPRPDDRFFVGVNRERLPHETAAETLRKLFQKAGLKPAQGRGGPRPYDLRHTFAVHRLSRWYRQGVDLHARLPWLSAYMGHDDILGTETYLTATPELLQLAGSRLRRRCLGINKERSTVS